MTPVLVAALLTLGAIQPCAPFHNSYKLLSGTLLGVPNTTRLFHSEAEARNIDARLLVAVAMASTGGSYGCAITHSDPFTDMNSAPCTLYPNMATAITEYTSRISSVYIHATPNHRDLDYIGDHEHWPNMGVRKYFTDLLGRPTVPLLYSSSCCGDCDHNQSTEINELIYTIILTLCSIDCPSIATCALADADFNGELDISDLIRDVLSALDPCPGH